MNKRKILPIAIVILIAISIALLYAFRPTAGEKPTDKSAWRVSAQKAHLAPHSPQLSLIGQVESSRETTLSSPSNAYVKEVLTEEGRQVIKGELLATLDPSDEALRLAQREADIADLNAQIATEINRYQSDIKAHKIEKELSHLANKSSKRYGNLAKQQVGSDVQWDDSKQAAGKQSLSLLTRELAIQDHPNRLARLNAQLAKVTALRDQSALDLSRTEIRAPFNGRVTQVLISPQNRLRAGDTILKLYDIDSIEVRAQIPLKYLSIFELALEKKTPIKGSFESSNLSIPIHLSRLSGAIENGKGGIDGLFSVNTTKNNANDSLISDPDQSTTTQTLSVGRSIAITVQLPTVERSLAVPAQAIYGQDRMYTIEDSHLVSHHVVRLGKTTLADSSSAFLIDSANITEGADILTTQIPNAISGMEVQIIQPASQ